MKQEEYLGFGSIKHLKDILRNNNVKNIFLVTGKDSYELCGAEESVSRLTPTYSFSRFQDFEVNPKIEDVERGIPLFREEAYDIILAIGGGSVMDMAKLLNIFSPQSGRPIEYVEREKEFKVRGVPLIAIPTTAGSGSEATHFAVVYVDGKKYSVAHQDILPNHAILDPSLTMKLPSKITASTGMDALSQAIESYWNVDSTDESQRYAQESINLVLENLVTVVNNPSQESRNSMLIASHLAGKAINITKTTAPHALSYHLTSKHGIPHGHAVALTLGEILVHNSLVTEEDFTDKRGVDYVKKTMHELNSLFSCSNADSSRKKIRTIMNSIGLETRLSSLGIKEEDIEPIIDSVNVERLRNNPRSLTKPIMKELLFSIL